MIVGGAGLCLAAGEGPGGGGGSSGTPRPPPEVDEVEPLPKRSDVAWLAVLFFERPGIEIEKV